ncbi:MAG TPA: phBC6A51 family helix-turn-helix protein [Blastocatellia bacterium]|nr:phBC6A51 family helix-turn-helix protein [Blastocatellia bacterium]
MKQNETRNSLSAKQEQAAFLVADDKLSDEAIAAKLDIGRTTLHRWKSLPEFKARVAQILKEVRQRLKAKGIAAKENRIAALVDRQRRMEEVIRARAKEHKNVPGGRTGLLVKETRFVKVFEVKREQKPSESGDVQEQETLYPTKRVEPVDYYAVDTALLNEMRATEKQAAVELGEWTVKHEVKVDPREALAEILGVKPEDLPSADSSNA